MTNSCWLSLMPSLWTALSQALEPAKTPKAKF
jgi:hypothetical protein